MRRPGVAAAALAAVLVLASLAVPGLASPAAGPRPVSVVHRPPTATPAMPSLGTAPGTTLVATTHGAIPGSTGPGAPPSLVVPGSWYGYPSILPVIADAPGWVEVRLAQRPNGSVAWVPQSDVTLSSTPYAIVVNLATEHMSVYLDGQQILDFPAGIGAPSEPTPPGQYFVTMQAPPPNAGYGPLVLVTSDHSDAIADWEGSGDAIIAIHGPITTLDDQLIGTTGAAISHGCIRLHNADLAQLANIPAGTPIDIIPGAPATASPSVEEAGLILRP